MLVGVLVDKRVFVGMTIVGVLVGVGVSGISDTISASLSGPGRSLITVNSEVLVGSSETTGWDWITDSGSSGLISV
jgi:hypothetical protein